MTTFFSLPLRTLDDVATARRLTSDVARVSGMSLLNQSMLATVVSGLARRTLASSQHGEVVFSTVPADDAGLRLAVTVFDGDTSTGPGHGVPNDQVETTGPRNGHGRVGSGTVRVLAGTLGDAAAPRGVRYVSAAVLLSKVAAQDRRLHQRLISVTEGVASLRAASAGAASGDVRDLVDRQVKEIDRLPTYWRRSNSYAASERGW